MKVFSLLSTAAITVCFAASGFCEEDHPQGVEARISQKENVISHSTKNGNDYQYQNQSYQSEMQNGKMDDPNRMTHSVHGCMSGFSIGAEFLWWRAQMDNLDYAIQNNASPPAAAPFSTSGRLKEPNFSFDPGVRVSVGYDFGKDNWDVFFRWTYQNTDVTDSSGSTGLSNALIPIKDFTTNNGVVTVSVADTGRVKWQNKLNVLDFEMGYDYFLSRRASLRPFFGLKAAWIDMDYSAVYGNVISNQQAVTQTVDVKTKSDYWGVGPMVGMDGYLHIGWGFSVYGQTSAALVYGQYDSDFRQSDTTNTVFVEKKDGYARQRAVAIIGIGLEWAHCFSGDYMLAFNLGWEGQYWWNQYELLYAQDVTFHGDLTYTGLNAGFRFDF